MVLARAWFPLALAAVSLAQDPIERAGSAILIEAARPKPGAERGLAARGPDWYGDWMMWWSTNREDFFPLATPASPSQPRGSTSRPSDENSIRLISAEDCRRLVIPVLLAALKDGERQIREAGAIALGTCGGVDDVEALVSVLADKDRAVAEAAVMGLGLLGAPDADKALGRVLADPSEHERKRSLSALALGLSGGDDAKQPLFEGLGSGKSDRLETCRMVGAALWTGADGLDFKAGRSSEAAAQIQKGLVNQESKRRKLLSHGVAALARARDPGSKKFVLDSLQDPRFDIRAAAAIAAGRVINRDDKAGVHALLQALDGEAHTLPTRFLVISIARIGGPDVVARLTKDLGTGDKVRRAFNALAVGIVGAVELAPRLRQDVAGALEDRVKGAYLIALGMLKDPQALAPISQIAQGKTNDELLEYCMWALALLQNREAIPIIERVLSQSRVPESQEAAATALGILGAVESQPKLSQLLLGKSQESNRRAAAFALGRMRDQRGLAPLLEAARRDSSVLVRASAIQALGALARRSSRPPFARIAIDAYYGIQNEAIDEIATRAGSLMKTTEEGGAHGGDKFK